MADHAIRSPRRRPRVILVEESSFYTAGWEDVLGHDVDLQSFDCPSAFTDHVNSHPGCLAQLDLLILDYKFDNERSATGLDIASWLRTQADVPPIVISSDQIFSPGDLDDVTAEIGKLPLPWSKLSRYGRPERRTVVGTLEIG